MRLAFPLLLLITCSADAQLRSWTSTSTTASTTLSETISTVRFEFRIENLTQSASTRYVVDLSYNAWCRINANSLVLACQFPDAHWAGGTEIDLTGRTDVRVRWQRDYSAVTYKLETWDGDCSGRTNLDRPIGPMANPILVTTTNIAQSMALGFLRIYSTTDNSGACPVDAPATPADIVDLRFDSDSLADSSGNNYTVTGAGTFGASTHYNPFAAIASATTVRAGQPITLASTGSWAATGDGLPSSYFWQQASGPAISRFDSRTASTTTVTPPLAGEYVYRLAITDSTGAKGTVDVSVGAVAADANGVVISSNPVIGTSLLRGAADWPWYEVTETADVDLLSSLMSTAPTETPGTGTIYMPTTEPNKTIGDNVFGLTYGNIALKGIGTSFDQSLVGQRIALHWDPEGDGSNKGRVIVSVSQVIDSTTIVLPNYYWPSDSAARLATGMAWSIPGASWDPYSAWDGNSYILNFYEAGLAVARLYNRTGLTKYRDQFHAFCDNWWYWSLDAGWNVGIIPRNASLHFAIACAADPSYTKPTGMWEGIARSAATMGNVFMGNINPTTPIVPGEMDAREASYILRWTALLAAQAGGTVNRSTWCGYLANQVTNTWIAAEKAPGESTTHAFFGENVYNGNQFYIASASPAGSDRFGTSPWRSAGLPAIALMYAYEALADPDGCNNPALAAQLYASGSIHGAGGLIPKVANYIWDYGRSADGGVLYAEGYETHATSAILNSLWIPGYVSVSNGSTAVTGLYTRFLLNYGPCNGTTQITLGGSNYTVASCADDTHLTLASAYSGTTLTNSGHSNPATIAVTNGSTTVVGTGTGFQSLFAPCDGTTYIGIPGAGSSANRPVLRVVSCEDNTHLTVNTPFMGTTQSGLSIFGRAVKSTTNCGPLSLSTQCQPDDYNGRNLSADVAASAAWLYRMTGNATWKTRGEYYLNKSFGGPTGGSGALGSPSGSCVYSRPGTVTLTNGSTAVTGSGTAFLSQFACDGTDKLAAAQGTGGKTWATVGSVNGPIFYSSTVASCASDTALTLASPWAGTTTSATGVFYNPSDSQWNCADGGTGNLGEILPNSLYPKYGKPLGMASGAGNGPNALADLKGGVEAEQPMTVTVGFHLASVPNSDHASLVITKPDGSSTTYTCPSSPCSATIDRRQGAHLVTLEYRSATDQTLARREPMLVGQ